jgi:hypothetical protein
MLGGGERGGGWIFGRLPTLPTPSLRTICRDVIEEPSVVYPYPFLFFCSDVIVVAISVAPALTYSQ